MNALELLRQDPYAVADHAANNLCRMTGVDQFNVAIILGSGWDTMITSLGKAPRMACPVTSFPGFLPSTVAGHAGDVIWFPVGDRQVLAFSGRKHLYEEVDGQPIPIAATVHAVRVAAAAGCKSILLTNAVGGTSSYHPVGRAMVIKDHFSLFVPSPLSGPRFLQCKEVYSRRLRALSTLLGLPEGVYTQIRGPHFETPFEYSVLRQLGVDIVGMSIATEALAARDVGMEVLAISCITDVAGQETNHHDVLAVVRETAAELGPGLAEVIKQM